MVWRYQHTCPVNSYNEWDTLEEVIVGRVEGSCVPPLTNEIQAVMSENKWPFFRQNACNRFPVEIMEKAHSEVENLCHVLTQEGVRVRRPDECEFKKGFQTPDFSSPVGLHNAMPR